METVAIPPDVFPSATDAMLAATLPLPEDIRLPVIKHQYVSLSLNTDESNIEAHCSCGAYTSIAAGDSMAGRVLRRFTQEHADCH